MKWFKHMTDASTDEKIVQLIEDHGGLGYGRWWRLLEMIAAQMGEDGKCHIAYRPAFVTRTLWFHTQSRARMFLGYLEDVRLISWECSENVWLIKCPNLLKIRARKTAIGRSGLHIEEEVEEEVDVEKEKRSSGRSNGFDEAWNAYPARNGRKPGKQKALSEWKKLSSEEKKTAMGALKKQILHYEQCRCDGVFVAEFPDAHRWLRDKRWEDDVYSGKPEIRTRFNVKTGREEVVQ